VSARGSRLTGASSHFWASGVALVALIAVGTLFLVRTIGTGSDERESAQARGEPDVRMEGALMRQFGTDGAVDFALTSPEIRFFRDEGRAEMTQPDLTLYQRDRTAWQVRAASGSLHGEVVGGRGEAEVRLQDDVLLQPLEGPRRGRLTTQSLSLYPDRQYAATVLPVIIDGEGGRTAAAGLEGDLQGGVLKLFSSADQPVQTILLPGQFK